MIDSLLQVTNLPVVRTRGKIKGSQNHQTQHEASTHQDPSEFKQIHAVINTADQQAAAVAAATQQLQQEIEQAIEGNTIQASPPVNTTPPTNQETAPRRTGHQRKPTQCRASAAAQAANRPRR